MRRRQIVIIGSGDSGPFSSEAYEIGRYIAEKNYALISGGKGGIMEATSRGAAEANGTVVGIIPGTDPDGANSYCSIVIPTGIGHARNMTNVLSGDIVIAIGGSWGTLSEISFSQIFNRPLIVCAFAEGWSNKIAEMQLDTKNIHVAKTLEDVFGLIDKLCG